MTTLRLVAHPVASLPEVQHIEVDCAITDEGALAIHFRLHGDINALLIPPLAMPGPAEGLWNHTCFEVFIGVPGESSYREFNLSTSGGWAAYLFSDYRQHESTFSEWALSWSSARCDEDKVTLSAELAAGGLPEGAEFEIGLAAVVERADGTLGYWALAHPQVKPDFHDRGGFALRLSAFAQADEVRS